MATISKVPVLLSGFLGGPGVSTFYILGEVTGGQLDPLQTFYSALSVLLPDDVTAAVPSSGVTVDSVTGELTGGWAGDVQAPVTGSMTGSFISGAGCVVRWVTGTVIDGRLIRGRTFIVPLASNQFENNGLLTTAAQGAIDGYASSLVTAMAGSLLVWHRPVAGAGGAAIPTLGPFVPRTPAMLRSRRD